MRTFELPISIGSAIVMMGKIAEIEHISPRDRSSDGKDSPRTRNEINKLEVSMNFIMDRGMRQRMNMNRRGNQKKITGYKPI